MADPGTFSVDTDGVSSAVPPIGELSASLLDIHQKLVTELAAHRMMPGTANPAWGNDSTGQAFAGGDSGYVDTANTIGGAVRSAGQGADQTAKAIQQLADGLTTTEEDANSAAGA
jgi:hypothetical protein